jgi:hypothetical protein
VSQPVPPVLVGDGIRLLDRLDRDVALHLAGVRAHTSGAVWRRYEVRRRGGT